MPFHASGAAFFILMEHAWKVCMRVTVSRTVRRAVQISSSLHYAVSRKWSGFFYFEGARLESVYAGNRIENGPPRGSNLFLST